MNQKNIELIHEIFGSGDPRLMSSHLFSGSHFIDYETAIKGDITKQDYTVAPRHWYVDARFRCVECREEFVWTANEQKVWFEDYRFWVDSRPRHCKACRAKRRHYDDLRKEYDSLVASARSGGAIEIKSRIIAIVSELEQAIGCLPNKVIETKELFQRQLKRKSD